MRSLYQALILLYFVLKFPPELSIIKLNSLLLLISDFSSFLLLYSLSSPLTSTLLFTRFLLRPLFFCITYLWALNYLSSASSMIFSFVNFFLGTLICLFSFLPFMAKFMHSLSKSFVPLNLYLVPHLSCTDNNKHSWINKELCTCETNQRPSTQYSHVK
jgi:hypothetical protein